MMWIVVHTQPLCAVNNLKQEMVFHPFGGTLWTVSLTGVWMVGKNSVYV